MPRAGRMEEQRVELRDHAEIVPCPKRCWSVWFGEASPRLWVVVVACGVPGPH